MNLSFSSCFSTSPLRFSNISFATSKLRCFTLSSCFVNPYDIPSVYTCTLSLVIKYTFNDFSSSKLLMVTFSVVGHPTCAFSNRITDGCTFNFNASNFVLVIALKFRGLETSWVVFAPSGNTKCSLLFHDDAPAKGFSYPGGTPSMSSSLAEENGIIVSRASTSNTFLLKVFFSSFSPDDSPRATNLSSRRGVGVGDNERRRTRRREKTDG